ncbi:hypothetical protein D9756_002819 [Leucocoprinus leucothites]|uniref:F-box domain-containing protein n=1 Tax=Leucocoprinus leucothites TaxID=201217 RepID=A0A8H5LMF5_9AGAR|nr:hypothetical protein D9756_002819 [Leucoagaricus leucothites]
MDISDECRFIESTLSRISAEITTLLAQKARLRQRLNTLRAHTSVLPPETLACIFDYTCLGHRDRSNISSVCSHWHKIVQTTPSLFTFISMRYNRANAVDFLLHHHRHAKDIPLNVELHAGRYVSPQKMRPLLNTLLTEIPHNLKSLTFHNIDQLTWSLIEAHSDTDSAFPKLTSLALNFSADAQNLTLKATKPLFSGSRIRTLSLRFAMPGLEEKLPLEDITLLDAKSISSEHGMRFLIRCPKVVNFSWEVDPGWRRTPVETTAVHALPSLIILPFLKTLMWRTGDMTPVASLIQILRLPSIQRLEWEESPLLPQSPPGPRDFRQQFFLSMAELRILQTTLNESTAQMIRYLPTIITAEITCSSGISDIFLDLIRLLTWTEKNRTLPCLKALTIILTSISRVELDVVIEMLESRRAEKHSQISTFLETFTLRVGLHDITEIWEKRQTVSLKRLVKGGLELIIWEDQRAPGRMLVL